MFIGFLKKTGECKPYEFAMVNKVALIRKLLSPILITKFYILFNSELCLNNTF